MSAKTATASATTDYDAVNDCALGRKVVSWGCDALSMCISMVVTTSFTFTLVNAILALILSIVIYVLGRALNLYLQAKLSPEQFAATGNKVGCAIGSVMNLFSRKAKAVEVAA